MLDTHVWIWLLEGTEDALTAAAIKEIEAAAAASRLAVAAISVWELAMLEAKGRISLSRSIEEWTKAVLTAPGLQLVELSPEVALQSTRLPGKPLGDPADRLIIATARTLGGSGTVKLDKSACWTHAPSSTSLPAGSGEPCT